MDKTTYAGFFKNNTEADSLGNVSYVRMDRRRVRNFAFFRQVDQHASAQIPASTLGHLRVYFRPGKPHPNDEIDAYGRVVLIAVPEQHIQPEILEAAAARRKTAGYTC